MAVFLDFGDCHGISTSCDSKRLDFCSSAHTVMTTRPPIRNILASSRIAFTRRSVVAKWWITASESTASKLSSRNGNSKLSQIATYRVVVQRVEKGRRRKREMRKILHIILLFTQYKIVCCCTAVIAKAVSVLKLFVTYIFPFIAAFKRESIWTVQAKTAAANYTVIPMINSQRNVFPVCLQTTFNNETSAKNWD